MGNPNVNAGFAPSAPKMEHKWAADVYYLTRNFSFLALTVTEILMIKFENLTRNFGEGLAPSAPKLEHNKVPIKDYLQ